MRRIRYGLNGQTITSGLAGDLTPLAFYEVAPGDTIKGKVSSQMYSATTNGLIVNRCYYDMYAFYVPFRLLWDGFPQFVAEGTGTVPKVTNTFPAVFEKSRCTDPVASLMTKLVPWNRRAYNMIWNKYFKRQDEVEVGLDDTNVLKVRYRPTDFHRSEPDVDDTSVVINTSGTSIEVDDVRAAFAADHWTKTRQYYGERYTDYLRAFGVHTGWTINEEPERIGIKSTSARFHITNSTTEGTGLYVGYFGGKFTASNELRFGSKFFPEHGVVVVLASFKGDTLSLNGTHPISCHDQLSHYWSPEYETVMEREYPKPLWYGTSEEYYKLPNFEHLRKGLNMTTCGLNTDNVQAFGFFREMTTADVYKEHQSWAAVFQDSLGKIPGSASIDAEIGINCLTNLRKQSAVGTRIHDPIL